MNNPKFPHPPDPDHPAAEQDLAHSSLELALWGSGLAVWDWDMLNDRIRRSSQWSHMLGYEISEIREDLGQWAQVVHPADRPLAYAYAQEFRRGEQDDYSLVFRMVRADGATIWVREAGKVVERNEQGLPVRAVGTVRDVTKERELELGLAESRRKLQTLLDNLPGMAFRCRLDDQYSFEFVSQGCRQIYGLGPEELVGVGVSARVRRIHAQDIERVGRQVTEAVAAGHGYQVSYRVLHRDGQEHWVWEQGTPVMDDQGQVVALEGFISDITERRRTQLALAESEERLRVLFEEAPDAILVQDMDDNIVEVNQATEGLLGYRRRELLSMTVPDLQAPEVRGQRGKVVRRELELGRSFEGLDITRDGRRVPVEVHTKRISYSGRDLAMSIVRDIGARKKAEMELARSEAALRAIFGSVPIGLTLMKDRVIRLANQGLADMLGYHPAELAGMPTRMLYETAEEYERVGRLIHKGVLQTKNGEVETRWLRKDGQPVELWLKVCPIEQGEREMGQVVGVAVDITERKQAEQERRQLESQLRHAQKMESVGTLAGGVAHDFNNLLTAVIGYAELATERLRRGGPATAELEAILGAADRAKDLVRAILTFSRKVGPVLAPLDLNQEVRRAVRILERTIPRMIAIETRLDRALPSILADAGQMEQVLLNLGANARDAMPDGGTLYIETAVLELDEHFCRLHPGTQPGPHVQLTVTDTGQGMPPDVVEHIFDPFFTTKPVGSGTGLGLSMVHGIVENHKGHISCYSEPLRGTTFKVYLPAMERTAHPDDIPDTPSPEVLGGSETIMVVDDEQSIRDIACEILGMSGYQCLAADSGEAALALYDQWDGRVDLVLLDVGMPGMGGLECLNRLQEKRPEIKVIIASGYAKNERLAAHLARPNVEYVAKPFRRVDLLLAIRRLLDRRP